MAANRKNPDTNLDSREAQTSSTTQQRHRGITGDMPGREPRQKPGRSSRRGEHSADVDATERQNARSESLLSGDESSNIDEPRPHR